MSVTHHDPVGVYDVRTIYPHVGQPYTLYEAPFIMIVRVEKSGLVSAYGYSEEYLDVTDEDDDPLEEHYGVKLSEAATQAATRSISARYLGT